MDIIKALPNAKPVIQCISLAAMPNAASSNALLHLRDVKLDMALHLHVLLSRTLHFVLDLLFEVNHLGRNVSMISASV